MKDPESQETADSTEQSGRRAESSSQSIRTAHTLDTDIRGVDTSVIGTLTNTAFEDQACSLQAQGPITWAKTVQVIYFQEPQVRSVQKLFHHFATRPRHNEHMEQCQEEDEDQTSEGN